MRDKPRCGRGETLIANVTIALLATIAGFITALWILLLWVGDGASPADMEGDLDPILGARDQPAIYESYGPFIPMPDHLRTHDQMIAWMTKELPKLTAEISNPRG